MNWRTVTILILLTAIFSSACTSCVPENDSFKEVEMPAFKPGKIVIQGNTKTIGPTGGEMKSPDSVLTILFPEGSLAHTYDIEVHSIENTNPAGIGPAYRIGPNHIKLERPVQIRMDLEKAKPATSPKNLLLAHQDDHGIWKAQTGVTYHKNSISLTTYSLGDWSLSKIFQIPKTLLVRPGEQIEIKTKFFFNKNNMSQFCNTITTHQEIDIVELQCGFVESWALKGAGTLWNEKQKTFFKAPETIPDTNPIILVVKLQKPEIEAIIEIFVAHEGLSYKIDDGNWNHTILPAAGAMAGINQIIGPLYENETPGIFLFWEVENENMPWRNDFPQFKLVKDSLHYFHYNKTNDDKLMVSPGSLYIFDSLHSGFVRGRFILEKSGVYDTRKIIGNPFSGTAKIEGYFILKKEPIRTKSQFIETIN